MATSPTKTQRLKVPNQPLRTLPSWGCSSQTCSSGASPTPRVLITCPHTPPLLSNLLPPPPPTLVAVGGIAPRVGRREVKRRPLPSPALPAL